LYDKGQNVIQKLFFFAKLFSRVMCRVGVNKKAFIGASCMVGKRFWMVGWLVGERAMEHAVRGRVLFLDAPKHRENEANSVPRARVLVFEREKERGRFHAHPSLPPPSSPKTDGGAEKRESISAALFSLSG